MFVEQQTHRTRLGVMLARPQAMNWIFRIPCQRFMSLRRLAAWGREAV